MTTTGILQLSRELFFKLGWLPTNLKMNPNTVSTSFQTISKQITSPIILMPNINILKCPTCKNVPH